MNLQPGRHSGSKIGVQLESLTAFLPGLLVSAIIHVFGVLVMIGLGLIGPAQEPAPRVVQVKIAAPEVAPQPISEPPPIPEVPKEEPKEDVRQARARESVEAPPVETPPEIRGGLSDSVSTTAESETAPAVALGNSSEVAVDPALADSPPPSAVPIGTNGDEAVDYNARAVEEVFADSSADCSAAIPQLDLTEDAINAGVTSGELVFETIVDEQGRVRQPKLVRGTGFEIDRVATEALAGITCAPAMADGKPTVVRKEIRFRVVDF